MTRSTSIKAGAVFASLLIATLLLFTTSRGAFSASTNNTSNSWAAGTVTISDDDLGSVTFSVTNMKPGVANAVENCIVVTYDGSLVPADVSLYGTSGGGLGDYLDTTIEVGSGGAFGDCTGFSTSSTIFSGTLTTFGTTHTDFASGLVAWSPSATSESLTYRFYVELQDDNAAQGTSASADFTWEAQNQ